MTDTTGRVLALLSLLESRPTWSGTELAEQLGVTTRTIRRDVERLRDLGYPVRGEQGVDGGYRLGRGMRLPPLVLGDDEAVAVALCLRIAATNAPGLMAEQALRALAKLDQVLPARLSARVHAIAEETENLPGLHTPAVEVEVLTSLVAAAHERVRVRFDYTARDGATTQRHVHPYRLVTTGRIWYLFCFDVDRDDWRTFRLDRMRSLHVTTFRFEPRDGPDPREYVQQAWVRTPWRHTATVTFNAPVTVVRGRIPEQYGRCEELDSGRTQVVAGADDLADLAHHLAWAALDLRTSLEVVEPAELNEELRQLGEQIASFAR